MNRKQIILVTLGALFAALPLAAKSKAAPLQPGKYADWNGSIDRMEIVKTFSLADYQRVRVEPLDTKNTPLPPASDKRHALVVNVLNRATELLVEGMRRKFHPQHSMPIEVGAFAAAPAASAVTPAAANAPGEMSAPGGGSSAAAPASAPASAPAEPAPAPPPASRTLLLRARVSEMNPGSKAARWWVGMGAGHSDAEITGEVLDADSGEVLIRFTTGRGSSATLSITGGNYEDMMSTDTRDAGENVGGMLSQFK